MGTSSPSDAVCERYLQRAVRGRVRGILHDCRLPEDRFGRCICLSDGKGSAVVEDPEPPELMDPEEVKKRILFLIPVVRNGERDSDFFLCFLVNCFFF